jgi:hypothetical protein
MVGVVASVVIAVGIAAIAFAVWQGRRARKARRSEGPPALVRTDPRLIVCREVGRVFPTGFDKSRCIAVGPNDVLYISGDSAVRRFGPDGRKIGEFSVPEPPGPLAVDANGTVFAGTGGKIMVFAPDGQQKAIWPGAEGSALLTSIAVAGEDVFAADAAARVVRRYDKAGKLLKTIGRKDPKRNIRGFVLPSPYFDLAAAPDGLLRVVNPGRHHIEAYTVDGDREGAWGQYGTDPNGFSGCCNPANFALVPGSRPGRLGGFVTAEKGPTRLKIHGPGGRLVGLVAALESFQKHDRQLSAMPPGQPFQALDVAVGRSGRIFVLDPVCNEVRTFERTAAAGAAQGGKP